MATSLSRCSVSSLSLSALSISSDDGSQASQSAFQTMSSSRVPSGSSLMRKSWGSNACQNLAALATPPCPQMTHQVQQQTPQQVYMNTNDVPDAMMMDEEMSSADEWGYFVDSPSHGASNQGFVPQW